MTFGGRGCFGSGCRRRVENSARKTIKRGRCVCVSDAGWVLEPLCLLPYSLRVVLLISGCTGACSAALY